MNIFNYVKSVISAKLESSTSQKGVYITYNIDTVSNGNLMSFKIFRILFPNSQIEALHSTENKSVILKIIKSVKYWTFKHVYIKTKIKNKTSKTRSIVVP